MAGAKGGSAPRPAPLGLKNLSHPLPSWHQGIRACSLHFIGPSLLLVHSKFRAHLTMVDDLQSSEEVRLAVSSCFILIYLPAWDIWILQCLLWSLCLCLSSSRDRDGLIAVCFCRRRSSDNRYAGLLRDFCFHPSLFRFAAYSFSFFPFSHLFGRKGSFFE